MLAGLTLTACSETPDQPAAPPPAPTPSILLVTLDTTRADATGLETDRVETPALAALAARGLVFTQAYATAPETLPSHASMLTGRYPPGHGIHQNSRHLRDGVAPVAARLAEAGYATAAFVSGFPLDAQFGLAQGFERYDDDFGEAAERAAAATTDLALAYLERQAGTSRPLFLWVHYYDPHIPYDPPEPFRSRYEEDPYSGEIAAMDHALGRLLAAFEEHYAGSYRVLVAGDHGEGLGDHGEVLHGNLLYQGVMRVPLVIAGEGVSAGERSDPVSVRRVHDTLLAWAGLADGDLQSLLDEPAETVLAEGMKPHLQYGWQPQVMAVRGRYKLIRSGETELYDVVADPGETQNLADGGGEEAVDREIVRELERAVEDYPLPAAPAEGAGEVSEEDRAKLASLGYVSWEGGTGRRQDAPSPRAMTHLFADLDLASGLFVHGNYEAAVPVLERVLAQDPENLMAAVRLAVAQSLLGRRERALATFERARRIGPESIDVTHYRAMHHLRFGEIQDAGPLFEEVLAADPRRPAALSGLARVRQEEGRYGEAAELLGRAVGAGSPTMAELVRLGELRMAGGDTPGAIQALERARERGGEDFTHHLELGVLYQAAGRLADAATALDRVPSDHPGYPMALFKRAQVAVLAAEPDRAERIRRATEHADETTRPLIEREALFREP